MELIKSKRITISPIINKGKQNKVNKIMNNFMNIKNEISFTLNNDKNYQNNLRFNKPLTTYYKNFSNYKTLLAWERQKFVNEDLILKDKERYERFFKSFKSKIFIHSLVKYKNKVKINKTRKINRTKLSKLLEQLIQFEYIKYYYKDTNIYKIKLEQTINKSLNNYSKEIQNRIINLKEKIISNYFKNRKAITYTTGSLFRTNQKELGKKLRLIQDKSNKYQYYYLFDYREIDSNNNIVKKTIRLPLAYNKEYHGDLKQYSNSLGKNKFKKGNIKTKINDTMIYRGEKIENLLNVEHCISLSKSTNRLNITLTHKAKLKKQYKENKIIGIDIGGGIDNSLALDNGELKQFKHLYKLINKLDLVDKIEATNEEERKDKGNKLAKLLRENEFNINKFIANFLEECKSKNIYDLVFEKLDQ